MTKQRLPIIACLFCPRTLAGLVPVRGWDWFTGYFDRTVYVCPTCQKQHWRDVTWLYETSHFPPVEPDHHLSLDAALQELHARHENETKEPNE